jgi:hypothetical protein
VLYACASALTAVAESFAFEPSPWDARILYRADDLQYHLATLEIPDDHAVCDLDDPQSLLDRKLRPSQVITRDRTTSQAWALRIFQEERWSGISWWSFYDPDTFAVGLWRLDRADLMATRPLTMHDSAMTGAAELLNRSIVG